MHIKTTLPFVLVTILLSMIISPVFGQGVDDYYASGHHRHDERAINGLLTYYESAFNERDIDWRMSLCLDTYVEYGFTDGDFLFVRDYDETREEVGGYWESIDDLDYSLDEIEITIDGPQAFVRAYSTHLAEGDNHSSVVHFCLVKINGAWRIAWDSFNIVSTYD